MWKTFFDLVHIQVNQQYSQVWLTQTLSEAVNQDYFALKRTASKIQVAT